MHSSTGRMTLFIAGLAATIALAAANASAGEARPWLCRDKPVFSYNTGMQYEATSSHGGAWKVFFMAFDPGGGHDGFEIVRSADLSSGSASGPLERGRYFAVALYRQGGNWICPGYAHDSGHPMAGQLNNICYGKEGPPCQVTLVITAAAGNNP